MFVLRAASATGCSAVNGGATTISTSSMPLTMLRRSVTNATDSDTVLYIFQLPAMNGILICLADGLDRQESRPIPPSPLERRHLAGFGPPRNSSDAPPPVEMCVILSAMPAFFTAAIESPPPMMVVPFTAATARATALVPAANASISKTPIGPFQTTVFASAIDASYAVMVAGPMSTP